MSRIDLDPLTYLRVEGENATLVVAATEAGQQFAGNPANRAHARGSMLAGMLIRVIPHSLEAVNPALVGANQEFPFQPVMSDVADAAQPPLLEADREQFMAGARQVLGGNA